MTKEEARHVAEVYLAFADGVAIQYDPGGGWVACEGCPDGDTITKHPERFRIKPKPREWWIVGSHLCDSLEEAQSVSEDYGHRGYEDEIVPVREVL